MKNEVKPITITALDHCSARVASCSGREMVVEKARMLAVVVVVDDMYRRNYRRPDIVRATPEVVVGVSTLRMYIRDATK